MSRKKGLGGRPPFEPTKEQRLTVEMMASFGIPQAEIAKVLQISEPTLHKYFQEQLDVGKARTITKVAASLVKQALNGNVSAAIFYLKTQGGWRETPQAHEHTHITHAVTDQPLSADEWEAQYGSTTH